MYLYTFAFKSVNATNYTLVKMLVLTLLSLAVVAEGYRLDNPHSSPMGVNMIREMCHENGANYTAVENAAVQFVSCMEVDFEVKMFENELKEALMYHTYDAFNRVFKKYCHKSPEMKACYHKLVDVMAPCFDNDNQPLATLTNKIMDQILNYVCENDGNIMTKFIMEGGPQCFQEKTYDIMMCSEISKSSILKMEQSLTLSATEGLRAYDDFLKCISQNVETCHSPISTKIVRRIGEIVKKIISEELSNETAQVPIVIEAVSHDPTTPNTTERGWYKPTTSTERYWYKPTTSTERYRYRPTTTTDRYWDKPTTTTERYRYRPTTTTDRYWDKPTTTTERYRYRPTTATDRYWDKSTTTTEKMWNHVNTAWQNKKGAPTNGRHNQDQDTKNITCNSLKKLFKASGTINVALNADIYI